MKWQETGGIESVQFTMAMLAVYVAVFGAQFTGANLAVLQLFPWRLGHGEIWRLVTCTLLHGSIIHFAFNMIWFFRFSQAIERWLGPWIALGMYVLFAIGSGAAQALGSGGMAIGASGVVYGMFGFLWVTRRRYDIAAEAVPQQVVQTMLGWLVICVLINHFGGNIANTAHVFGLIFGYLIGYVVVARRRWRIPVVLGTAVLWLALLSLTYRPIWERTLFHMPYLKQQYMWVLMDESQWQEAEDALGRTTPNSVW